MNVSNEKQSWKSYNSLHHNLNMFTSQVAKTLAISSTKYYCQTTSRLLRHTDWENKPFFTCFSENLNGTLNLTWTMLWYKDFAFKILPLSNFLMRNQRLTVTIIILNIHSSVSFYGPLIIMVFTYIRIYQVIIFLWFHSSKAVYLKHLSL